MTTYRLHSRGSVLVMIIGMLTILFMLGATFLAVAHMNARTAEAVSSMQPRESLSEGLMAAIKNVVGKDRSVLVNASNASGPYALIATVNNPRGYVDVPDDEVDPWLASHDYIANGSNTANGSSIWWRHVSNLQYNSPGNLPVGNGSTTIDATGNYSPGITFTYNAGVWSNSGADTDGDGWPDAIWFNSGVTNDRGEKYYAAVHIGDTSGLLSLNNCANTYAGGRVGGNTPAVTPLATGDRLNSPVIPADASLVGKVVRVIYPGPYPTLYGRITAVAAGSITVDPTTPLVPSANPLPAPAPAAQQFEVLVPPYFPGEINLDAPAAADRPVGLGNDNYNKLRTQNQANAQGNANPLAYLYNCGMRLYSPNSYSDATGSYFYRPFSMSDEVALRWLKPYAANDPGRVLSAVPDAARRFLTTISCSPNISRYPRVDNPNRIPLAATGTTGGLDNADNRMRMVTELLPVGPATGAWQKEVLHLVGNLWAATSTDDLGLNDFKMDASTFYGPSQNYKVYGATEQLVFSEGVAWNTPTLTTTDTNTGLVTTTTGGWMRAFEIFNPGPQAIRTYCDPPAASGIAPFLTYRLRCGGASFDLPRMSIEPGARVVVYDYAGADGLGGADFTDADLPPGFAPPTDPAPYLTPPSTLSVARGTPLYFRNSVVDNFGEGKVNPMYLYRVPLVSSGTDPRPEIPLDRVTCKEIGYLIDGDGTKETGSAAGKRAERDDATDFRVAGDNRPATNRAMLGVWPNTANFAPAAAAPRFGPLSGHSLGAPNTSVLRTSGTAFEGFPQVRRFHGRPMSHADLMDLYVTGPESTGDGDGPFGLPQNLVAFQGNHTRGRLSPLGAPAATGASLPEVPPFALVCDMVDTALPDTTRLDEPIAPTRVYGRVNINTAPREVLMQLPWPDKVYWPDGTVFDVNRGILVNYIIAYRDRRPPAGGIIRDYSTVVSPAANHRQDGRTEQPLTNLRQNNFPGFASAAEIAIPLRDYVVEGMIPLVAGTIAGKPAVQVNGYVEARDSLYRSIAHLITVNSDTFAATIAIQLRDTSGNPRFTWRYMALFDRSNLTWPRTNSGGTWTVGQMTAVPEPATLIFTRMTN